MIFKLHYNEIYQIKSHQYQIQLQYFFDTILLSDTIYWQFWVTLHDISNAIYFFPNCFLYLTSHLKMILVIRNETEMRPQITSMFQCAAELRGRKCILRTTKWAKEAKKVTKRKEKNVKSGELNMMWKLTWDVKINFSCQNTQCIAMQHLWFIFLYRFDL